MFKTVQILTVLKKALQGFQQGVEILQQILYEKVEKKYPPHSRSTLTSLLFETKYDESRPVVLFLILYTLLVLCEVSEIEKNSFKTHFQDAGWVLPPIFTFISIYRRQIIVLYLPNQSRWVPICGCRPHIGIWVSREMSEIEFMVGYLVLNSIKNRIDSM